MTWSALAPLPVNPADGFSDGGVLLDPGDGTLVYARADGFTLVQYDLSNDIWTLIFDDSSTLDHGNGPWFAYAGDFYQIQNTGFHGQRCARADLTTGTLTTLGSAPSTPIVDRNYPLSSAVIGSVLWAFDTVRWVGFDVSSNTWISGADIPTGGPRFDCGTCTDGTLLYVVAGFDDTISDDTADVHAYHPTTDTWTLVTTLPGALREDVTCLIDSGLLHVFGGIVAPSYDVVDTVDVYDLTANTWSSGDVLPSARGAGAVLVHDGDLYIAGGYSDTIDLVDFETTRAFRFGAAVIRWAQPATDPFSGGIVNAVAAPQTLIAGGQTSDGLHSIAVSGDGGVSWQYPIADPLELSSGTGAVCNALATRRGLVVAGGSPAAGGGVVSVSTDDGSSWTKGTLPGAPSSGHQFPTAIVSAIISDSAVVIGLTNTNVTGNALYVSTDDGATWAVASGDPFPRSGPAGGNVLALAADGDAVLAVGYQRSSGAVYGPPAVAYSTDGGSTWTTPTSDPFAPSGIGMAAAAAGGVMLAGGSSSANSSGNPTGDGVVAVSLDGGVTWTATTLFSGPNSVVRGVAIADDQMIAVGKTGSGDHTIATAPVGSTSWTLMSPDPFAGTGADMAAVAAQGQIAVADPLSTPSFGTLLSLDGGNTWVIADTSPVSPFSALAATVTDRYIVFGGGPVVVGAIGHMILPPGRGWVVGAITLN